MSKYRPYYIQRTLLIQLVLSWLDAFSNNEFTPANLSDREEIISLSAHLFGIAADKAILAALIDRGAAVIMTLALGLIFSRALLSDTLPDEDDS